jgi:hypothetical protein
MLRRLSRRLTYANVVATLALIVAVGTGGAYAANTIGSSDIIDGQVKSADVGDGEILSADVKDQSLTTFDVSTFLGADVVDGTLTGADVQDGSLTARDVGETQIANFEVGVPAVLAHRCTYTSVSLGVAGAAHMLLTPSFFDSSSFLTYGIEYSPSESFAYLKACNPTDSAVSARTTHFELLVFQD